MESKKVNELNLNAPLPDDIGKFEEIEFSYHEVTDRNTGKGSMMEASAEGRITGAEMTGGDIDADQYQAEVAGEEAVGGTTPTPDQNVTEDLEKAVGLEMDDRAFLRTNDILEQRDDRRWELDPESSEDYQQRRE